MYINRPGAGFRTRDMNEEVIFKHAMVIWDRDDKESLGGKNIQVRVVMGVWGGDSKSTQRMFDD
jgi:hypothetical protein